VDLPHPESGVAEELRELVDLVVARQDGLAGLPSQVLGRALAASPVRGDEDDTVAVHDPADLAERGRQESPRQVVQRIARHHRVTRASRRGRRSTSAQALASL